MNTIKIYLKDSGSIAELYKDFRLYAGSYQDKSIKIYVPKSMVYQSGELNTMLTTVKVGAILTNEKGQKITTKSYAVVYIAEELVNGVDYLVYERKLPKEFSAVAGNQILVVNVENMLNQGEEQQVLSVITTQTAVLEVLDSAILNKNEVVEPTEIDLINGQINDIYQAIGLGEIDYGDVINRVETLENNSVTLNTEQTITATKTIDLPMNVGNGHRGLVFKKGSGGGTVPVAIEFVDSNNDSIALVSPASDGVYFSGNITFMHNRNNFSIDEVPTKIEMSVDPSNYVLTTNLKNDSNTVLSTARVDLPLESMVVNGTYDSETKEVVLTLQNGNEVRFSVADLVSGLVSQTDFDNIVNNTTKIKNSNGGFAGGSLAQANSGGAIGRFANADYGGAVGQSATASSGGAVGENATTSIGGAIGWNAKSDHGGAIGASAKTSNGFAGGYIAQTIDASGNGIDAIQLGTGTNQTEKSLQVYDYTLMNADGTIPAERLTNETTARETADSELQTGIDNIVNNTTLIQSSAGGFSAGYNSKSGFGAAIGRTANASQGGAVGHSARTRDGGSVGHGSYSNDGGAVGGQSYSDNGGAVGYLARTSDGFAGGYNARAVDSNSRGIDAIQLGTGTNSTAKTLQVYNDNIYNANTHTLTVTGAITDGTNSITIGEIVNNIGGVSAVLGNTEDLGA